MGIDLIGKGERRCCGGGKKLQELRVVFVLGGGGHGGRQDLTGNWGLTRTFYEIRKDGHL